MATIKLAGTIKTSMVNQLISALDAGSGASTIKVYTGTMPASPETAITSQTLLGTLTCSDPCGTESGGVLTFSSITQDSAADATGTATWARFATSAGTACMDVDISTTGGGGALQMNTTSIVAGGPITITSLTFTLP